MKFNIVADRQLWWGYETTNLYCNNKFDYEMKNYSVKWKFGKLSNDPRGNKKHFCTSQINKLGSLIIFK